MKTLIVDNYDSFTFNLHQYLGEVNGEEPIVITNDRLSAGEIASLDFDNIVISPGPGRPERARDFGVCARILAELDVPTLGVCLGHQGIAHVFGAAITHAPEPMHGRSSLVAHDGSPLFEGIPPRFEVVRYHSLMVAEPLPSILRRTAWTEDGIIMGLCRRDRPVWGVQFHPESICTQYGKRLLENFRELTRRHGGRAARVARTVTRAPSAEPPSSPPEFEVRSRNLGVLHDPEALFVHLFGREDIAFWLDSSRVDPELSRFSMMGGMGPNGLWVRYDATAGEVVVTTPDGAEETRRESLFAFLDRELRRRRCESEGTPGPFNGGFVGYLGYELRRDAGAVVNRPSTLPDGSFLLADRMIVLDHRGGEAHLVCLVRAGDRRSAERWFDEMEQRIAALPRLPEVSVSGPLADLEIRPRHGRAVYLEKIHRCKEYILDGESYELCLTNQLHVDADVDALAVHRVLRRLSPAPHAAFLRFRDLAVVSSSPERFLRVDREGWVESKPIKGTRPRAPNAREDEALREALRTSEKDRAENLMIVDLVRNDLGRVCEIGSVVVPKLMDVESYATVHQLVSTVRGRLLPEKTALDAIRSAFPGGSMTGAPKLRTMELLEELEEGPRGIYSGAIGYLGLDGTADFNIVIRTVVAKGSSMSVGTGGAIVALSDPEDEYAETLLKADVVLRAIRRAASMG